MQDLLSHFDAQDISAEQGEVMIDHAPVMATPITVTITATTATTATTAN
ncbi:hypothetical protein [Streptomyces nigrescens]